MQAAATCSSSISSSGGTWRDGGFWPLRWPAVCRPAGADVAAAAKMHLPPPLRQPRISLLLLLLGSSSGLCSAGALQESLQRRL